LFSIAAADLTGSYLKLLGDLSTKAGVSFVSQAMPFVGLLHNGFQAIAGGDTLEIGRARLFDPPYVGRYAIVRATRKEMGGANLTVSVDGRELLANGTPVDRPHMILDFRASSKRNDWFRIPELAKAHADLTSAVRNRDYPGVESRLEAFRVIAGTCPDLLSAHAAKLASEINAEFRALLPETVPARLKTKSQVKRAKRATTTPRHKTRPSTTLADF
jgi:hypothetical protein